MSCSLLHFQIRWWGWILIATGKLSLYCTCISVRQWVWGGSKTCYKAKVLRRPWSFPEGCARRVAPIWSEDSTGRLSKTIACPLRCPWRCYGWPWNFPNVEVWHCRDGDFPIAPQRKFKCSCSRGHNWCASRLSDRRWCPIEDSPWRSLYLCLLCFNTTLRLAALSSGGSCLSHAE